MKKHQQKEQKAEEVILYVCHKMAGVSGFGSVLFNKLLLFIDQASYLKLGNTLTGFSYVKQVRGPTPSPSQFMPLMEKMQAEDKLKCHRGEQFGYPIKRTIGLQKPDVTKFSPEEIALMDEVIENFKDATGAAASELSHEMLAFKVADMMEDLPDYTFLLNESDLTEKDLAWGKSKVAAYQKQKA
jgi:hypothetical protein